MPQITVNNVSEDVIAHLEARASALVEADVNPKVQKRGGEKSGVDTRLRVIRLLKRRLHLGDLLEQVSDANRHGEVQTGAPRGEEER